MSENVEHDNLEDMIAKFCPKTGLPHKRGERGRDMRYPKEYTGPLYAWKGELGAKCLKCHMYGPRGRNGRIFKIDYSRLYELE